MNKTALQIVALVSGLLLLACGTTTAVTPTVPPGEAPPALPTDAPPAALPTDAPPAPTDAPPPAVPTDAPPPAEPTFTPEPSTVPPTAQLKPGLQLTRKLILVPTATPTPKPQLVITARPPIKLKLPDLYVSEFQLTPNPPNHTQSVHVRIGVYNKGNAATAGSFKVEWWAGSNYPGPACMWTVDALPANGGQILQCDKDAGTWASGYAKITTQVRIDPGDAISESDEGNNVHGVEISVK